MYRAPRGFRIRSVSLGRKNWPHELWRSGWPLEQLDGSVEAWFSAGILMFAIGCETFMICEWGHQG